MQRIAAAVLWLLLAFEQAPTQAFGARCAAKDVSLLQASRFKARRVANVAPDEHAAREAEERIEYESVGCFQLTEGDSEDAYEFEDKTCVQASRFSADAPCRSGLPFFRLRLRKEQSFQDCFTFCLSKGLDLSGVVAVENGSEEECRCGATAQNEVAWHMNTPSPALMLPAGGPVPADDPRCKVAVWRYTGRFEDRGVPFRLTQMSTTDVAYMDEIAESIDHIDLEDDPSMFAAPHLDISDLNLADIHFNTSGVSLLSTQGLCYDSESTGATGGDGKELTCPQLRNFCSRYDWVQMICPVSCGKCSREGAWLSCYPGSCGPGSPWKKEGDIVVVDYYFSGIAESDTRRNAFRQAAKMWEDKTCINFVEGQQKPANRGCIKVTVTNEGSCSANVGYPGDGGEGTINLGWCKDSRHIGSIAHEIGHAIGMYHEQNRPDGPKAYRTPAGTKGPYLNVFWGNIASNWVSQYTPRDNSYIGSVTAGYAEYDYSAIMHYGAGNAFETVNPLFRNVPGQRSELSKGDIEQFEDMYQCRSGGDGSSPTPTPTTTAIITTTTTTTTTTSTGGDVTCTDDSSYRGPWGDSCANWQTWMESGQYQCSQYARWAPKLLSSCRAACKTCDATTSALPQTTAPATTTTTTTTMTTTSATTSKQDGSCEDDPSYKGPWNDSCASWERWEQAGQYKCDDYARYAPGLLTSCPEACRKCSAATTSVPESCSDDADAKPMGYSCDQWATWITNKAVSKCENYGNAELLEKCPKACRTC